MITFVSFHRPVVFASVGSEHWSLADSKAPGKACSGVVVQDKGTHMLFTLKVRDAHRRVKVPLTNIAFVVEEETDETKKEKQP